LAHILQNPNTNLTTISKSSNNNLALFLQSANTNLATISKSPNNNLALFYKAQIIIWQLFYKDQSNILAKTITLCLKPKCYFSTTLQSLNAILAYTYKAQILFFFYTCFTYINPSLMGNIITHPLKKILLLQDL